MSALKIIYIAILLTLDLKHDYDGGGNSALVPMVTLVMMFMKMKLYVLYDVVTAILSFCRFVCFL